MQVDEAALAEGLHGLTGRGIQRIHPIFYETEDAVLLSIPPMGYATITAGGFGWGSRKVPGPKGPSLRPRSGIEGDGLQLGAGQKQRPVDYDRIAINRGAFLGTAGAVAPRRFQLVHVRRVDLGQFGILFAARITSIDRPFLQRIRDLQRLERPKNDTG